MATGRLGVEGGGHHVAYISLTRWPGGCRAVGLTCRERGGHRATSPCGAAGAAGAVEMAPRAEAPWVAVFPPPSRSVKHAPFQRPRTPSPPGREEGTTRLSLRGEAGGALVVPGQAFPRALLGAALASGGSAAPGAGALNGGEGSAASGGERELPGKQTPLKSVNFLVFSRGCKERGFFYPSACGGGGCPAAGVGFR